MSKADFVQAQGGDFNIWPMIAQGSTTASKDQFLSYVKMIHREKSVKKKDAGDRWCKTFLHTLEKGLDSENKNVALVTAEKAVSWEAQVSKVISLFDQIAKVDGDASTMSKMALTLVQQHDFGHFAKASSDQVLITRHEWLAYVKGMHTAKEVKKTSSGDRWLNNFLQTLETNLCWVREEEEKALCVYDLIASLSLSAKEDHPQPPVEEVDITRAMLYAAYDGDEFGEKDESHFDALISTSEGTVDRSNFIQFIRVRQNERNEETAASGDGWVEVFLTGLEHGVDRLAKEAAEALTAQAKKDHDAIGISKLQAWGEAVFSTIAASIDDGHGEATLSKAELVRAQGAPPPSRDL